MMVAHSGMVKPIIAARPAIIRLIPWAEPKCQPVILNRDTANRGKHSFLGTERERPLNLAKTIIPIPPQTREMVLKVQGGISSKAVFITGQLTPQKIVIPRMSKYP